MELINFCKFKKEFLGRDIKSIIIASTKTNNLKNIGINDILKEIALKEEREEKEQAKRGGKKKRNKEFVGFHFLIKINGDIELGLGLDEYSNIKYGYNKTSITIVYVGGLDEYNKQTNDIHAIQKFSMQIIIDFLLNIFKGAKIVWEKDLKKIKVYENK